MLRAIFVALTLAVAGAAYAEEQIDLFDAQISVARNGDIDVTEALDVTAEGAAIRHGIFRDLPRYYESRGERLPYDYAVVDVQRDGSKERYATETDGNAFRIRIGDPDALVANGAHHYVVHYRVKNQIRYFDHYDELYWNVTGNYWAFPILRARAAIVLPPGAKITAVKAYTGALGETGADYQNRQAGDTHVFETTRAFAAGEGLTVAIGFEKGLIDPPSASDAGWLWWHRNGALAILIASLCGLCWFLYHSFDKVGRDPPKGPVFARYEPPAGYSPGAVHYIYHRGLSGHRALIGTLMYLAVNGRLSIDASDKKTTTLLRKLSQPNATSLAGEDVALENSLFADGASKEFGKKYDPGFTAAYTAFTKSLERKYGAPYFRRNAFYTGAAIAVTIAAIWLAAKLATNWTIWDSAVVVALAALNLLFLYLMPAPTSQGQTVRTQIEGFRLYMEVAEKLQLNAAKPGAEAPPPMTVERYEKFLPYAVALDVEKPWTHHFERLMPEAAKAYTAAWTNSGSMTPGRLSASLVSHISSGVSSALPQSSSSSGSGGGGSSGGGGGGGGGGGW